MIKTQKLKGTLTLGAVGSELDASCQVIKCAVEYDHQVGDPLTALCGDTTPGELVTSAALVGEFVQDYSTGGVVDWTHTHHGANVPFVFVPDDTAGKEISGVVMVQKINVGGEVGERPTSEFEWPIIGQPAFTPVTP